MLSFQWGRGVRVCLMFEANLRRGTRGLGELLGRSCLRSGVDPPLGFHINLKHYLSRGSKDPRVLHHFPHQRQAAAASRFAPPGTKLFSAQYVILEPSAFTCLSATNQHFLFCMFERLLWSSCRYANGRHDDPMMSEDQSFS